MVDPGDAAGSDVLIKMNGAGSVPDYQAWINLVMDSLEGDFVVRLDEQSIVDPCHPLTERLLLGGHFVMLYICCEYIATVILVFQTYGIDCVSELVEVTRWRHGPFFIPVGFRNPHILLWDAFPEVR